MFRGNLAKIPGLDRFELVLNLYCHETVPFPMQTSNKLTVGHVELLFVLSGVMSCCEAEAEVRPSPPRTIQATTGSVHTSLKRLFCCV